MKTRDDEYLRVKQAAAMMGIAPNTMRKWGRTGKIPEYRHPANSYRLYKRSDLEKMIAQVEQCRTIQDREDSLRRRLAEVRPLRRTEEARP
jgi:DNA-binding transcriptional MerR regulator